MQITSKRPDSVTVRQEVNKTYLTFELNQTSADDGTQTYIFT